MNNGLRRGAQNAYEQLVKGTPYLVLLISTTVSIALSIMGNGIFAIFAQIFPLLILIGLYLARTVNRTGVKMVQVCASILFWIYCILCGLMLAYAVVLIAGASNGNLLASAVGGLAGLIIAGIVILLQFFFPILYYRDIKMIMKDILGWFVAPGEDASTDFPPESRHRVSCKLVVLCIIQLVLNGISALYLLAMMSRTSITSSIGGMFLDGITGGSSGSSMMNSLIPGTSSIFSILAEAAIIAKFVCVILLYKQYLRTEVVPQHKPIKEPAPSPEPDQGSVTATAEQPAPKQRSVRIILERKSPKEGRFSASMTSEMIVGRKEGEAKLVIPDDQAISSRHMRLVVRDNKLYAEDLGSHNGIYVNGRRVEKSQQIHRGDEIRIGNSVFVLRWET